MIAAETKSCTKCGQVKPLDEFHRDKNRKDGRCPHCRMCAITAAVKYNRAHPKRHAIQQARWQRQNRARARAASARWYDAHYATWRAKNHKRPRAYEKARKKKYPEKVNADTARRRAMKLHATPKWANQFFIEEIYDLARLRTKHTGYEWQVDHIVPLRSKLVCGLHWEGNLRVIPKKANLQKSNRHWPDMPQPVCTRAAVVSQTPQHTFQ